jgi:hypothetical protein
MIKSVNTIYKFSLGQYDKNQSYADIFRIGPIPVRPITARSGSARRFDNRKEQSREISVVCWSWKWRDADQTESWKTLKICRMHLLKIILDTCETFCLVRHFLSDCRNPRSGLLTNLWVSSADQVQRIRNLGFQFQIYSLIYIICFHSWQIVVSKIIFNKCILHIFRVFQLCSVVPSFLSTPSKNLAIILSRSLGVSAPVLFPH